MKRLYLLRHAKSVQTADLNGDHERPLAPRGVTATERLTRYLRGQETHPSLVLCSSARRTLETLERIAPALRGDPDVTVDAQLYCASSWQLLQTVRGVNGDVDVAMVIGHNPGLRDLAVLLAHRDAHPRLTSFPTGALATLDLGWASWADLDEGSCQLFDYVVPRELQ